MQNLLRTVETKDRGGSVEGADAATPSAAALHERYAAVRATTERITAPLTAEDQQLQSMTSCSPTKWHRAHVTWFFETFVLAPRGVPVVNASYKHLFNSYYVTVGSRHPRPKRGMLSRPTAEGVTRYRRAVDERMLELLTKADRKELEALSPIVELGLAHEQQHQELMLTDILNAFSENPLFPACSAMDIGASRPLAYAPALPGSSTETSTATAPQHSLTARSEFVEFEGGLVQIGADGAGFSFDNERPRHRAWLEPFALSRRLVTVGEMKEFIAAGGYRTPELWLSEGFDFVQANAVEAPLYWYSDGSDYQVFGLQGMRALIDDEPVTNVSYYEADAVARFLGGRLPTEREWEAAASGVEPRGNLLESGSLRPLAYDVRRPSGSLADLPGQLFGDAWEWTSSSYDPYPGYRAGPGALGEYNGKFMVNQKVLRGGSHLTPRDHVRPSYRNFWHAHTRFQVSGFRLAKDA